MLKSENHSTAWRPPWTDEARVLEHCTSCGDCLTSCPEAILTKGRAGTPVVQLNGGYCTFCGACADACKEDVFRPTDQAPWALAATIGADCLLHQGVSCQSCTDSCDEEALKFNYCAGRAGAVTVRSDLCTGCGACLAVCPTKAISLDPQPIEDAA